jgi:hypothetical protein
MGQKGINNTVMEPISIMLFAFCIGYSSEFDGCKFGIENPKPESFMAIIGEEEKEVEWELTLTYNVVEF